jgi:predicted ATPase/DNA-binding SARP family transcriptional activator
MGDTLALERHRTDGAKLHIHVFGHLQAMLEGRPLPRVPRHETAQLWIYLLLHRGLALPRGHVAFEIWPDTREAEAKAKLRRNLHRLAGYLPARPVDRPWLVSDSKSVGWNPSAGVWLDLELFEALTRRVQLAAPSGETGDLRLWLEQAAKLYRGDLALGFDDAWLAPPRERLRACFRQVLDDLGALEAAEGHAEAAREAARRLLALDPLFEPAISRLMRAHAALGDRVAALAAYEDYRARLAATYAIAPAVDCQSLYAALRDGAQIAVPGTPEAAQGESPGAPAAASAGRPGLAAAALLPGSERAGLLSRLIGREQELASIAAMVDRARLVTLIGPGGVGKTRLADAAAQRLAGRFAEGVRWIDLAGIADPARVVQTVATAMGVHPVGGRPLVEALGEALREQRVLLILDNCEHVLDAVADLAVRLLAVAPDLRVLATSRERLGLDGELVWPVPPLSLPAVGKSVPQAALLASESVQLFLDRVAARWPAFETSADQLRAVAGICLRLEGIPLAIELAAARVSVLSVEQIAARLDDSLKLLRSQSRSLPLRHQTMTATITWSFQLLTTVERAMMRHLAVFVDGFTLKAAEAVCAFDVPGGAEPGGALPVTGVDMLDLITLLVDKSLITVDVAAAGDRRFRLLEVIRQYAWQAPGDSGERAEVERRHAAFFLALAEQAAPHLRGPESMAWFDRLDLDQANIRSAILRARDQRDWETVARFTLAIWIFWNTRAYLNQEIEWIEEAVAGGAGTLPTATLALLRRAAGSLHYRRGDYAAARDHWQAGLDLDRALVDAGEVATLLASLGMVLTVLNQYSDARRCCEEALAIRQALGDEAGAGTTLSTLANLELQLGDYPTARRHFEASLDTLRRVGGSPTSIGNALRGLAIVLKRQGDYRAARTYLEEGLRLFQASGDRVTLARWLTLYALQLNYENAFPRAEEYLRAALETYQDLKMEDNQAIAMEGLGELELRRGNYAVARAYLDRSLAIRQRIGPEWSLAHLQNKRAELMVQLGQPDLARQAADESLDIGRRLDLADQALWAQRTLGRIALDAHETEAAAACLDESLGLAVQQGDQREVAMTLDTLAALDLARGQPARAARAFAAAEGIRGRLGAPRSVGEQAAFDQGWDTLRRALPPPVLDRFLAESAAATDDPVGLVAWVVDA